MRQYLESALATPAEWIGDHDLYVLLADAAAQQGDETALRHYASCAEDLALRYRHELYLAVAHRAWSVAHRLAGEYAEAEARLRLALDLFTQLDTRWQLGRTRYAMGELALARSDTTAARDAFTRALEAFEELRAIPDAGRCHAALASLP